MKDKRYKRVELSYRGTTKFSIDGASFHKIGDEYAKRNFDYVLYTVPAPLPPRRRPTSDQPVASDRDALLQFHRQWYGEDQTDAQRGNGM